MKTTLKKKGHRAQRFTEQQIAEAHKGTLALAESRLIETLEEINRAESIPLIKALQEIDRAESILLAQALQGAVPDLPRLTYSSGPTRATTAPMISPSRQPFFSYWGNTGSGSPRGSPWQGRQAPVALIGSA